MCPDISAVFLALDAENLGRLVSVIFALGHIWSGAGGGKWPWAKVIALEHPHVLWRPFDQSVGRADVCSWHHMP